MFPWIGKWIADRKEFHTITAENQKQNQQMFSRLKETLNPHMCRGFVDAFLLRMQNLEVGKHFITYNEPQVHKPVMAFFAFTIPRKSRVVCDDE